MGSHIADHVPPLVVDSSNNACDTKNGGGFVTDNLKHGIRIMIGIKPRDQTSQSYHL